MSYSLRKFLCPDTRPLGLTVRECHKSALEALRLEGPASSSPYDGCISRGTCTRRQRQVSEA